MDIDIIDNENLDFILERYKSPVMAVYRTGSTVTGKYHPGSDIDYLVVIDSEKHYKKDYRETRESLNSNPDIDNVVFSKKDLDSPSTIPKEYGFDKLAYLMREIRRERIILHGEDVFDKLLNYDDLKKSADSLKIDQYSMKKLKNAVFWE